MKILTFPITPDELESFKEACEKTDGVSLIRYDEDRQRVEFGYDLEQNLFFLGRRFELYETQANRQRIIKELQEEKKALKNERHRKDCN